MFPFIAVEHLVLLGGLWVSHCYHIRQPSDKLFYTYKESKYGLLRPLGPDGDV